nr:hypothetical protein [Tanacetum cinerariifolium]
MGRDTVQQETAVTTISQEYGISEALHPELPGPEDRIVDFPEGKVGVYTKFFEFANFRLPVDVFQQEVGQKYLSMLYQAIRFPKKLKQPLLLGGREGVPDYCGLAHKCSKGWDASREYVFPRGCDDTEHTSHPNPETTRSTTLLGRVEPHILRGRRGEWDLLAQFPRHVDVSDPDPLSFTDPQSRPSADVTQERPRSEIQNQRIPLLPPWSGHPKAYIDQNGSCTTCTMTFLKQYNVNLARQVAMGSQLWLRLEQEAKLLKKSVAQVTRRDKRIQARENEIKNLETLLEAETDMKKAAKNRSAELSKELENMRALFSDIQEFKQYEDNRVEQRCAEMDARLDAQSIDSDEELYPHMLTAIAGRRWVIGHGLRLAVMNVGLNLLLILVIFLLGLMPSKRSRKNTKCVNAADEELTAAKHKLML